MRAGELDEVDVAVLWANAEVVHVDSVLEERLDFYDRVEGPLVCVYEVIHSPRERSGGRVAETLHFVVVARENSGSFGYAETGLPERGSMASQRMPLNQVATLDRLVVWPGSLLAFLAAV